MDKSDLEFNPQIPQQICLSTTNSEDIDISETFSNQNLDKSSLFCNLWVSGLASNTKANDLKLLFTKYGKVRKIKIVTNAKCPGTKCYGFVTMGSYEEALKCIKNYHRTEWQGKIILIEQAGIDLSSTLSLKRSSETSVDFESFQGNSNQHQHFQSKLPKLETTCTKIQNTNITKSDNKKDILTLNKIKIEREKEKQRQLDRIKRQNERILKL